MCVFVRRRVTCRRKGVQGRKLRGVGVGRLPEWLASAHFQPLTPDKMVRLSLME